MVKHSFCVSEVLYSIPSSPSPMTTKTRMSGNERPTTDQLLIDKILTLDSKNRQNNLAVHQGWIDYKKVYTTLLDTPNTLERSDADMLDHSEGYKYLGILCGKF